MNKIFLIGNLTKDVMFQNTPNGVAVAKFNLAVRRKFQNADGEKETDFIECVAWRKTAELCRDYLAKGKKVAVTGSLQVRNYDANDGTKRYVTEVIVEEVEFLSSAEKQTEKTPKGMTPIDDEEIPF